MKIIRNIIICLSLVFMAGCETYEDYEIEYSSVYPLAGEWIVTFTDLSTNVTSDIKVLSTYNTENNSTNQMWVRCLSYNLDPKAIAPPTGRFSGKVDCNVAGLTFNASNVENYYFKTLATTKPSDVIPTFSITEASIVKDGFETLSGGKSDKISFKMTDSRKPGVEYLVEGFRRTRWLEDEGIEQ